MPATTTGDTPPTGAVTPAVAPAASRFDCPTEPGVKAATSFRFANYSKDTVDITFQVSGFQNDGRPDAPDVRVFPEDGRSIVGPGETRKFILEIDPKRFEPGIVYTGAILAKTPFLKRLDVEFQVAKGADKPKAGGGKGA